MNDSPYSPQPPRQDPSPPHHQKQDDQFLSLSRQVSDLLSRLRLLEERYANLRREHQTTSQNMIENHQHLSKQQRRLNDSLLELKRGVHDLQEQLGIMQGELVDAARSHDLKVLDRYLDFWKPLSFLTRAEAERLVEEATARKFYKDRERSEE
ncbi:hypothetical protein JXA12_03065 [Candidatus Woesearchaeota archaeon]|nr:hypothetical protein [Candidatus Woesearchaeota archaeon]